MKASATLRPTMDPHTATFQEHRSRLMGVAYRMLGSRADAEDALQDAWLRWQAIDAEHVPRRGAQTRRGQDVCL